MRIFFERHALIQMENRSISREQVEETLLNPDRICFSIDDRKIAQKLYKRERFKFLLRIIYIVEDSDLTVLSAYWTTRIEKYSVKK